VGRERSFELGTSCPQTMRSTASHRIGRFPDADHEYTCRICGQPGKGPWNARVHPGRCRDEWQKILDQRKRARKRDGRKR